jgi:serine/threonine protein kinase
MDDAIGTPGFIAPERRNGFITTASDVFSLGAIFRLIFTPMGEHCDGLIEAMTDPDPSKRPTAEQSLSHTFFARTLGQEGIEAELEMEQNKHV